MSQTPPEVEIFQKLTELNLSKLLSGKKPPKDIVEFLDFVSAYCLTFPDNSDLANCILNNLSKEYRYDAGFLTKLDLIIQYLEGLQDFPNNQTYINHLKKLQAATKEQFCGQQIKLIHSSCYQYQSTLLTTIHEQIASNNRSYLHNPNPIIDFNDTFPVIVKIPLKIDILIMATPPKKETISTLPNSSDRAYVRVNDQLFYIDKKTEECTEIKITAENLALFDKEVGFQTLSPNQSSNLSETQLQEITSITSHTPPAQYRYYSPIPPVIVEMPAKVDILIMSETPQKETINTLPNPSNKTYVRVDNRLFYIDKINKICTQIDIAEENLALFDKQVNINTLSVNQFATLSKTQLQEIRSVTGHAPLPQYKYTNLEQEVTKEESEHHSNDWVTATVDPTDYTKWPSFVLSNLDSSASMAVGKYIFYDDIRRSVEGDATTDEKIKKLAEATKNPAARVTLASHRNPILRIIEEAINTLFRVKSDMVSHTLPIQLLKTKGITLFNNIENFAKSFSDKPDIPTDNPSVLPIPHQ